MRRDNPYAQVTIPNNYRTLAPGTLKDIVRNSGLTVDEFLGFLQK